LQVILWLYMTFLHVWIWKNGYWCHDLCNSYTNFAIKRRLRGCLGVWLWLLFKVLFTQKSVPTIFFLFFKNYFWDQHIKIIWKYKKHITSKQKKNQIFSEALLKSTPKQALSLRFNWLILIKINKIKIILF
jgi:hypothetical protein